MKCPSCLSEVQETQNFCGACGAALVRICSTCGATNALISKFCGNCGAGLDDDGVPASESRPEESGPDRRPVTIMFCDLVGSTAMSERLDPEELRELVGLYQRTCVAVVERFEGHVAQYLGDGILIYFGYPQAHEDDARRAVHAGLGVISAMNGLNQRLARQDDPLRVRVGVHTGLVVAGEVGHGTRERLALGQAPNVAARIHALTQPDTVAISAATYDLTEGYFECESLGTPTMKGVSQELEVYRVLHATGAKNRIQVATAKGLGKLIGRERELAVMRDGWELARQQQRHSILISGEAGIGKSRLVAMFKDIVSSDAATWVVGHCSAYTQHSAFAPVIDLLEQRLQFVRSDSDSDRLNKLEVALDRLEFDLTKVVPLIATLLDLPTGGDYGPLPMDPEHRKRQMIRAINDLLIRLSRQNPLVLLFEDLHWADPSTLDLLGQLLRERSCTGILSLFTFRPSFTPCWDFEYPSVNIELTRLTEPEIREFIGSIVAPKTLPEELIRLIMERTDGVPLFVEELTKTVLESEQLVVDGNMLKLSGSLQDLSLPSSLHSSLVARLDRLGKAKETAQLGSVLGRQFSYGMLRIVSSLDDGTLHKHLVHLVDTQLLVEDSTSEGPTYMFRHALIQDAAHDSLLRKDRARLHQEVAEALVASYPDVCETRPEIVAQHYSEAGAWETAIDYWQRAGDRARDSFNNAEAIQHFSKGLDLLVRLPEPTECLNKELALLVGLGAARSYHDGWQAPATGATFERAFRLCQELPAAPELFWVLWQLGAYYQGHDIGKGSKIAEQLVRMAEAAGDPELKVEAYFGMGTGLFLMGRLADAHKSLEITENLYASGLDRSRISPTGQAIAMNNLVFLGMTEYLMGRAQLGLSCAQQAVALATEHAGPPHQAAVMCWHAFQLALHGDSETVVDMAQKVLELKTDFFLAIQWASMLRGWAWAHQGRTTEAITEMEEAMSAYRGTGLLESWMLTLQADGLLACGQDEDSLATAIEAIRVSKESGELFANAELHRIMGEAYRALNRPEAAQESFQQALKVAEEQAAKGLTLKASVSQARLLIERQEYELARSSLLKCLKAVDEGAKRHLDEARMLLEGLI